MRLWLEAVRRMVVYTIDVYSYRLWCTLRVRCSDVKVCSYCVRYCNVPVCSPAVCGTSCDSASVVLQM